MQLDVIQRSDLENLKAEILNALADIEARITERNETKQWLTENEAMKMLDVSKSTIRNYRLNGMLSFSQIKNKIYINQADIEQLIQKNYVRYDHN